MGAPEIAPGEKNDPLAKSISDLHDQATGLRAKISAIQDQGGVAGDEQDQLKSTEDQLHAQTQQMLARVPPNMQARIAKAVAPEVDWNDASQANAADPATHFATAEIGRSLRDQVIPPEQQRAIRQLARARGVNPDIAMHIADQAAGAKAVKDLSYVLRGRSIDPATAEVLKNQGLIHQADPNDPTSLQMTSDALPLMPKTIQEKVAMKPEVFRYAHVAKTPADALNLLSRGGMQRMADTARSLLPKPAEPLPGEGSGAAAPAQAGAPAQTAAPAQSPRMTPAERDAMAEAHKASAPQVFADAKAQVSQWANRFGKLFAGFDVSDHSDNSGGLSYDRASNRMKVSWNEVANSAGVAYSKALRSGASEPEARAAAQRKVSSILDEELRHVADAKANGDAATRDLWNALPPEIQQSTRRAYSRDNPGDTEHLTPEQLGYEFKRILSQHAETGDVTELTDVTRKAAAEAAQSGKTGWVRAIMDHIGRMVDWLRGSAGGEAARQLAALRAELARIVSAGPETGEDAHGSSGVLDEYGNGASGKAPESLRSQDQPFLKQGAEEGLSASPGSALRSSPGAGPEETPGGVPADDDLGRTFGDNWKHGWNALGLPEMPRILEADHPLLQPTHEKATAEMPADNDLVKGGLLRPGNVSREKLQEAVLKYIIGKARPVAEGEQPAAIFAAGGGGAGKSTILKKLGLNGINAVRVNADEIKELLPEYHALAKIGDGRAAAVTHWESSMLARRLLSQLSEQTSGPRYHVVADAAFGNPEDARSQIRPFKEAGFKTRMAAVTLDAREAMKRAAIRAKDSRRWVPYEALLQAHEGFNRSVGEYPSLVDDFDLWDTTGKEARLLKRSAGNVDITPNQNQNEHVSYEQSIDERNPGGERRGGLPERHEHQQAGAQDRASGLGESAGGRDTGGGRGTAEAGDRGGESVVSGGSAEASGKGGTDAILNRNAELSRAMIERLAQFGSAGDLRSSPAGNSRDDDPASSGAEELRKQRHTSNRAQPAREPSPVEKARDEIGANLIERPRRILQAHLEGRSPEEIGAVSGFTPEKAAEASRKVAMHVGNLLRRRGFGVSEIRDALTPGSLRSDAASRDAQTGPGDYLPKRTPIIPGIEHPLDVADRGARNASNRAQAARERSPVEKARDEIGANLIERPRRILQAHLEGRSPEEIGAVSGFTPEKAAEASRKVAMHVGNMLRRRGFGEAEIHDALTPGSLRSEQASQAARPGSGDYLPKRTPIIPGIEHPLDVADREARNASNRAQPAREPSPVEKARDEIGANLIERPRRILQAHLEGRSPEEIGAVSGFTPEKAAEASRKVAMHVGNLLRRRGFSEPEIGEALKPGAPAPDRDATQPKRGEPSTASQAVTEEPHPAQSKVFKKPGEPAALGSLPTPPDDGIGRPDEDAGEAGKASNPTKAKTWLGERDRSKIEQMTPAEYRDVFAERRRRNIPTQDHGKAISDALATGKPVSAEAADAYGIQPPHESVGPDGIALKGRWER